MTTVKELISALEKLDRDSNIWLLNFETDDVNDPDSFDIADKELARRHAIDGVKEGDYLMICQ